jgi:hypothetical protein
VARSINERIRAKPESTFPLLPRSLRGETASDLQACAAQLEERFDVRCTSLVERRRLGDSIDSDDPF